MSKVTMIGCDWHDRWVPWKVAVGVGEPLVKRFATADVVDAIAWLKEFSRRRGRCLLTNRAARDSVSTTC